MLSLSFVTDTKEKQGIFVDPIEWALANRNKWKTQLVGGLRVSPEQMLRDGRRKLIKNIQESTYKNLSVTLSYRNYVMFHRLCHMSGYNPTTFLEKLCAQFETNNEQMMIWLETIKKQNDEKNATMALTEDDIYAMLEEAEKEKRND